MSSVKFEDESYDYVNGDISDDIDDDDEQYYLVSSNKVKFPITKKEMKLSTLIKTAISVSKDDRDIPIPFVKESTMKHVMTYLKYHAVNPIPNNNTSEELQSNVFSDEVKCEWDVKFIENDIMGDPETAKSNIYDLINAANYMDIEPLLQIACTKIASMIKGESLDSIKKIISTEYPYVDNHKN